MRENGRIVNVSSRVGLVALQEASQALQQKYTSKDLTIDQLDQLVEEFILSIETNNYVNLGYNTKANFFVYGISKMVLNALTQIEARLWSNTKNILVVSVTPGFCATDMTHHASNARPAEVGADSILYVIDTPREELKNGGFYRDGVHLPFVNE